MTYKILKTKAYKLAKFYDIDIYLVFNYQRGLFIYNLVEDRSKIEGLLESPESNLSRLTRYFATRLEYFRLLEDLYRDIDLVNIAADKEALYIKSYECD
ncbi:uncharacterized protein N7500_001991 [Penicillium coprophilum]|uniref:uncharacterized protein n=1 Tax=Penicillium coprophilum TaxID=36646 RepID=UPI002383A343|nr:uncharacterized protein N7500_001991 [Penicillium coprophilum]KAJ5174060.1 hypothetical protein N7500_001991 [Penicillium coprophilum]